MPSPFPGMDPYLEKPSLWPDVHHRLISTMGEMLLPHIRPSYFAQIEERVYVVGDGDGTPSRLIAPDVSITEINPDVIPSGSGGTAMLTEPLSVMTLIDYETHEPRIEIIDPESREVVTVIEVLSPANKDRGSEGFESYSRKRREVLRSQSNFVEIDLLRTGYRYPISLPKKNSRTEYRVHVSKVHERPMGWVWPIRLVTPLPVIRIPLRKGDADVELDLQKLLDTTYDRAGYDLIVDYTNPPPVPVPEGWQQWIEATLAAGKGSTA